MATARKLLSATARQLQPRAVERVWGREILPRHFAALARSGAPIGEIWFDPPPGAVFVKHLFTGKKLSVQVHPDDAYARSTGHAGGKDEAWFITTAQPGATIGLGLTQPMKVESLRRAAQDGSIEAAIDWRPVKAGDVLCVPAGTIHAIGPGISLVELQQPNDITYRLYDYGRDRALHLDDALAVARRVPFVNGCTANAADDRSTRFDGLAFMLERRRGAGSTPIAGSAAAPITIAMIAGAGDIDGLSIAAGEVWTADGPGLLTLADGAEAALAWYEP